MGLFQHHFSCALVDGNIRNEACGRTFGKRMPFDHVTFQKSQLLEYSTIIRPYTLSKIHTRWQHAAVAISRMEVPSRLKRENSRIRARPRFVSQKHSGPIQTIHCESASSTAHSVVKQTEMTATHLGRMIFADTCGRYLRYSTLKSNVR